MHPPPYLATDIKGKKCLDYIFVSIDLIPAVMHSCILYFHSLSLGDHRPCYIDLDGALLFNGPTATMAAPEHRGLYLSYP